jgi:hypothetical protein
VICIADKSHVLVSCSFYGSGYWRVVNGSMGSTSSLSISAMAESRILRNLLRLWTDSDSGEIFVIVMGRTGEFSSSSPPDNACRMLFVKFVGWVLVLVLVLVLCVCGEDFMVVVHKGFSEWWRRAVV